MLVREGRVRLESAHYARLCAGMEALGIHHEAGFVAELKHQLQETLRRNRHEHLARVRLQVWPSDEGVASYCIETTELMEKELHQERGLKLGIASGILRTADAVSRYKTCNRIAYVLAERQAQMAAWDDALLLNQYGRLVESSVSNLWWMQEGRIYTPALEEGCVAGVVRDYLLKKLPSSGYVVEEVAAGPERLQEVESIWLSNAIRGLRWVQDFEGKKKDPGPVAALKALLEEGW